MDATNIFWRIVVPMCLLFCALTVQVAATDDFTSNVTSGTVPLAVQFNDTSVYSYGNGTRTNAWNFGDGSTSTVINATHTYNSGIFANVSLTGSRVITDEFTSDPGNWGGDTSSFLINDALTPGKGNLSAASKSVWFKNERSTNATYTWYVDETNATTNYLHMMWGSPNITSGSPISVGDHFSLRRGYAATDVQLYLYLAGTSNPFTYTQLPGCNCIPKKLNRYDVEWNPKNQTSIVVKVNGTELMFSSNASLAGEGYAGLGQWSSLSIAPVENFSVTNGTTILKDRYMTAVPPAPAVFLMNGMLVPQQSNKNIVFTFDDGWRRFYFNSSSLRQADFPVTVYAVPGSIGNTADGYMTRAQLADLFNFGWSISDHAEAHQHLPLLDLQGQKYAIGNGSKYLASWGMNYSGSVLHLAPPYGERDDNSYTAFRDLGLSSMRLVDLGYDQYPISDYARANLTVQDLYETTTVAEAESAVDYAIAHNTNVIFISHAVRDDPGIGAYDWHTSRLETLVGYIQGNLSSVRVLTVDQLIDLNSGPILVGHHRIDGVLPKTITFNDTSDQAWTSWNWKANGVSIGTGQNLSYTFTAAGNYSITLTGTNALTTNVSSQVSWVNITTNYTAAVSTMDAWVLGGNKAMFRGCMTQAYERGWFEYGQASGALGQKTHYIYPTTTGEFNLTVTGVPLYPSTTYVYRACGNTSCGDEVYFTTAGLTPLPTTTYGQRATEFFNPSTFGQNWTAMATNGPLQVFTDLMGVSWFYGIFFLTILGCIWMRSENALMPVFIFMTFFLFGIVTGMLPAGATSLIMALVVVAVGGLLYVLYRGRR